MPRELAKSDDQGSDTKASPLRNRYPVFHLLLIVLLREGVPWGRQNLSVCRGRLSPMLSRLSCSELAWGCGLP
jgi:hypothetical protein